MPGQNSGKESKKTVWIFSIASFLNDMGSDMIYPIWPLFVTSYLGANMAVLGLIDGLGEALVSLSQAVSGYYSDKWGRRKPLIWAGYSLGGISRIGYALSSSWQMLIPFKALDRMGKMRDAPRDAIIADVSAAENRGKNFGLLKAMDKLGAVSGILLCLLLFGALGYFNLFLLAAIPSIIGTMLIILFIKERKTRNIFRGFSFSNLDRNFKIVLISGAFFSLASFSYSFLLVYASDLGFSIALIPIFYLIYTAVFALASIPAGRITDRIGRKNTILISYFFFLCMAAAFITSNSAVGITIGFIFYGLHLAVLSVAQTTFVSEIGPEESRATYLGTFKMVVGLCAFPASLIAGFAWLGFGKAAPFHIAIAFTLISAIALLFVKEKN